MTIEKIERLLNYVKLHGISEKLLEILPLEAKLAILSAQSKGKK